MGLVAGNRRPETLVGSDDVESSMRKRRDGPGRPAERHRRRSVQNHEGGRIVAHRVRAVFGQERQRDQEHSLADFGRSS